MIDEDIKYVPESEIDKAFPYLDKLDEEIAKYKKNADKKLSKKSPQTVQRKRFNLFKIFKHQKPESKEIAKLINSAKKLRRKTLKHHNYIKDGYEFHIRVVNIYEDITNITDYYEFSVSIKYNEQIKKDQFYKKFNNKDEVLQYYKNMEGVFKHLTRRDLMERLFKEKMQEIEYYKNQC